ncbi:MAG: ATP-binding cassette domain-containing protein, partial [Bacteroidia bacterium]|nr:ATP-binding cassette domain-containing protein [Bacteroidia bacterium]
SSKGSVRGKHRLEPNLVGYLAIMHLPGAELYLMRYMGNGEAYLSGQALLPEQVYVLSSGSVIRGPRIEPIYYADVLDYFWTPSFEQSIDFVAQGLSYRFPSGEVGLHAVDLQELSGRLVGIMGGSGSGKSTLLSVLSGAYRPTSGQVTINGVDVHAERERLKGVVGFVAQDDLLLEDLTVYENLYYNARLCFGNLGPAKLHRLVLKTLDSLGLLEIRDLRVGNALNKKISGGQRKRLNIALELIREPSVLFVDEPTSGLSSRDSENVMDLLKELSLRGKLVFVVIHQPSSDIYKLFNRLLLLDKGGYPIYYGNPLEALRYFRSALGFVDEDLVECHTCGNVNAEQIFGIIETRLVDEAGHLTSERKFSPEYWNQRYQAEQPPPAPIPRDLEPPKTTLKLPSWLGQLWVFLRRDWLGKRRSLPYLVINLLEAPALAALLAYLLRYRNLAEGTGYTLYGNSNLQAYLLTGVLVALFIGLTVSAEEILRDRRIRRREAFLRLSRQSYLWSKIVLLMLLSALQMALFVLVGNAILEIEGMFWPHWCVLFSLAVFANLLGLLLSSGFNSAVTVYILVPILLIPQLVLSGALVSFSRLNPDLSGTDRVPLVGQLMASRWAYEALAVHQYAYNRYEAPLFEWDRRQSEASYRLDFWLPALEAKVAYLRNHSANPADAPDQARVARLVGTELDAALRSYRTDRTVAQQLRAGAPNPATLAATERLLARLRSQYKLTLTEARRRYDAATSALTDAPGQKLRHANEALTDALRARTEPTAVLETPTGLRQLTDPIFRSPAPATLALGAHFYAPFKWAFGWPVPTLSFNLGVIWTMTLGVYILLSLNALRWCLGLGHRLPASLRQRLFWRA